MTMLEANERLEQWIYDNSVEITPELLACAHVALGNYIARCKQQDNQMNFLTSRTEMERVDLEFCRIGFDIEQDADGKPRAYIYAEWNNGRDRADICRVSVAGKPNTLRCVVWDELRGLDTSYETDILVPSD